MNNPNDDRITELTIENAKLKSNLVCKRCGFDNSHDISAISEDLLKDYYKKMLTQQPFSKEYSLLDDNIIVTCVEPSRKLLSRYANSWDILGSRAVQYATDLLCLMLVEKIQYKEETGLVTKFETTAEERELFFSSFTAETIESLLPDFYQNIPQVVLIGIKRAVGTFNELCLDMAEAIQDENFWKGAGRN